MSDGILTILKFCLLAILYLFLARVVWVVSSELRGTPEVVVADAESRRSGRRRRRWVLVQVEPPAKGLAWPVDGELTIGRAGGCAISIPDDTFVSQVHARVFEQNGDAYVEDLGSTNGTLLNGTPVDRRTRLRKGDRVQVGGTVLEAAR